MPNIAMVLKSEISRVARKELRGELASLKRASAQHRATIAALRRNIEEMERALKRLQRTTSKAEEPRDDDKALRFRPAGLASHRKRLGLSAADLGKLLGVSGQSIYKWESGETRPRRSQLEAIAAVRKMGRREALAKLEAGS